MKKIDLIPSFLKSKHDVPEKPADVVSRTQELLLLLVVESDSPTNIPTMSSRRIRREAKQRKKMEQELRLLIEKIHVILYGDPESLPDPKACDELTIEFFKEKAEAAAAKTRDEKKNPFHLLVTCFERLEWQSQKYVSEIVASLLGQMTSQLWIASKYVAQNLDIVDVFITKIGDSDHHGDTDFIGIALLYNVMLRACIRRSQAVAKHILESEHHMKKLLQYVQHSNYTFASHVMETLEMLLTRHKSTASEFLSANFDWFFQVFNSKLLESNNVLTKFHALKILGDMLLPSSNCHVTVRYVSSTANLKLLMNLLRETKSAQLNAFKVFKLFVDNQHMPKGVADILTLNRSKLLQFFEHGFNIDQQFEADRAQVVQQIAALKPIAV